LALLGSRRFFDWRSRRLFARVLAFIHRRRLLDSEKLLLHLRILRLEEEIRASVKPALYADVRRRVLLDLRDLLPEVLVVRDRCREALLVVLFLTQHRYCSPRFDSLNPARTTHREFVFRGAPLLPRWRRGRRRILRSEEHTSELQSREN